MTTRPRLSSEVNWVAGLAAVALFGVFAAVFLTANFANPAGFPTDQSIVANIGYAMFDLDSQLGIPSEGFLVSFIVIAIVLDAALDSSIMLAERDQEESGAVTDGGQRLGTNGTDEELGGDE
ncbi:hypothetical protein [Halorientalis salina]|uniref:hypothetical protein n=1 Tax=Halorientalis salina TaxID=2932266 RepID=UPI0010AC20BB|nr:hypothetical protein [Halorientalis salina]